MEVDHQGRLLAHFDLEPDRVYDVILRVKLPGREPSVLQPRSLGGDVRQTETARPDDLVVLDDRDRHSGDVRFLARAFECLRELREALFQSRPLDREGERGGGQSGGQAEEESRR